jgi:hypothetical protein
MERSTGLRRMFVVVAPEMAVEVSRAVVVVSAAFSPVPSIIPSRMSLLESCILNFLLLLRWSYELESLVDGQVDNDCLYSRTTVIHSKQKYNSTNITEYL